ncbi:MAG: iron ABC transporter permease [Butyrivibrio sp.]|nr:iron ABC transporter permease [Butyrivibrio sp.]
MHSTILVSLKKQSNAMVEAVNSVNFNKVKSQYKRNNSSKAILVAMMLVIMLCLAVIAVCIGAYSISVGEVFGLIFDKIRGIEIPQLEESVIFNIRITRILVAIGVGMALASGGTIYQGIFHNPLIEPYILGVSSGAAFGAAVSVIIRRPQLIQVLAFIFGILAVSLTYILARKNKRTSLISLVLSGMIVSSVFSALVSYVQYTGNEEQLKVLVFWLMGGLYKSTWENVAVLIPVVIIGIIIYRLSAWKLNVLSVGEDEARALGIRVERLKILLMLVSTLVTSVAVSASGIIGWIGLMVPHAARMIVGPDNRYLIPFSAFLGGAFLVVCDTLARTLSTGEIPVSIISSLIGAPYMIYLIRKHINKGR